jgi:predicted GH43/DUF377 family glycosyl hydrolase
MKGNAAALSTACVVLSACSTYRDFTLPIQKAALDERVQLNWNVLSGPVLGTGAPGEFDSVDALNPSVIRTSAGYFNFYSGYDGRTWHTGFATSADGRQWSKRGRVLSPDPATWEGDYIAANGSALEINGEFWYWYQGGRPPQIGLARSKDGMQWTKQGSPVLSLGPRGSWDERGVADPYVIQLGASFYMFFLGQDRARRQRLGIAISSDGFRWHKLRSNPVLELGEPGSFDEIGLGEPAVWSARGSYWMLYTGRDKHENRRLGLARSQDGVRWQRVEESSVLSGAAGWNAKVVCDPSVEVDSDIVRVWFGGGDRAEPAENLNGRIGFATLEITAGTLAR